MICATKNPVQPSEHWALSMTVRVWRSIEKFQKVIKFWTEIQIDDAIVLCFSHIFSRNSIVMIGLLIKYPPNQHYFKPVGCVERLRAASRRRVQISKYHVNGGVLQSHNSAGVMPLCALCNIFKFMPAGAVRVHSHVLVVVGIWRAIGSLSLSLMFPSPVSRTCGAHLLC